MPPDVAQQRVQRTPDVCTLQSELLQIAPGYCKLAQRTAVSALEDLLYGACVSAACVILLKAFAKKKPTNVATDDELDLDFEIN